MTSIHPGRGVRSTRLNRIPPEPGPSDLIVGELAKLSLHHLAGLSRPLLETTFGDRGNARTIALRHQFGGEFNRREMSIG
jgi:hypothetical protein